MDMIRRLHRKFIWMATASVVAIIVLAVGLINGSLYVRVHHEISSITDIISQNGGTIPSDLAPQEKGLFEFGNWAEETPEFSYQARYFSILFDANKKEAKVINVNHIAAFNAKEAFNLAIRVLQIGKSEDFFLKDRAYYNYKITQTASGDTLVVFFRLYPGRPRPLLYIQLLRGARSLLHRPLLPHHHLSLQQGHQALREKYGKPETVHHKRQPRAENTGGDHFGEYGSARTRQRKERMDREYYQTDETPDEPYQRPCCPRPGRGNRKRKHETGRRGYFPSYGNHRRRLPTGGG